MNRIKICALRFWLVFAILIPLMVLIDVYDSNANDSHVILFYSLVLSFLHLCLIGISVNYIGIRPHILPCILPHYNYITIPISHKELLIREIKYILTHKYTFYIVVCYCIALIVSDIGSFWKAAFGALFISLLFFFTTFYVFFCNSDFKFTWLKRNNVLYSVPISTIATLGIDNIKLLIICGLSSLAISILLSVIYSHKAIKAMQQPFVK